MIGGWESFYGSLGEYDESPLAAVLPVVMQSSDDRCNLRKPCLIEKAADHEIVADLPWDRPPTIGGYNLLTARPQTNTLLNAAARSQCFAMVRTTGLNEAALRHYWSSVPTASAERQHWQRTWRPIGSAASLIGATSGFFKTLAPERSKSATGTHSSFATWWRGRGICRVGQDRGGASRPTMNKIY